MKGPVEWKRAIAEIRSRAARVGGKRNGAIGWIDDPGLEGLVENSKRRYRRNREVTGRRRLQNRDE